MATATTLPLTPGQAVRRADIPRLPIEQFRRTILDRVAAGDRIAALFGYPHEPSDVRLLAVLARDEQGTLAVLSTDVGESYPALTPDCPQAHWFEREIAEQWGVVPRGHPWLKPLRFHASYRPRHDAWDRPAGEDILPAVTNFFQMQGPEVHEVAVGPIHASVIEPGHFRLQCHGEHVFHLEVALGFQHRGVEPALVGGPNKRTLHYMETLAGDTTIGHTIAYCENLEALAGCQPPLRAQALRGIALELERLANHVGDLGGIANDVAFLPASAYCGRLRGDFLNATALICGNRFGRSLVRPGGVGWDVDASRVEQLLGRLQPALTDVAGATRTLWNSISSQARFEGTGAITRDICKTLGLVGLISRSCGLHQDVRHDFPSGIFRFAFIPISSWHTGDVFARAYVRGVEVQRSGQFVLQQLRALPAGSVRASVGEPRPDALSVALVEGWRGEICHVALTDAHGRFAAYKVVDPSFHNWAGLMMALRDQQISDFPLCNKSFSLSYCGHDL
jgi:Ni,Fe-hydrogenase III large subunit